MRAVVFLFLVAVLAVGHAGLFSSSKKPAKAITVKGKLMCGNETVEGAKIKLYAVNSRKKSDIVATTQSVSTGEFYMDGHSAERKHPDIFEPVVIVFHKCDLKSKKENYYRKFMVKPPETFVNHGRMGLKPYDIGTLNVQLEYPNETQGKEEDEE
uniref:Transthyretin-like family protein n=1 Tax=Steinernema glaseri TaxID=37863 RepID=A0A1I7YQY2_9BILA